MTTSKILLQSEIGNKKEPYKKVIAGKLLKVILVMTMLSYITLLSSCCMGYRAGQGRTGSGRANHGHPARYDYDDNHN